jgi:hypothetical protein
VEDSWQAVCWPILATNLDPEDVAVAKHVVFRRGKATADFPSLRATKEDHVPSLEFSRATRPFLGVGSRRAESLLRMREFHGPTQSPKPLSSVLSSPQNHLVKGLRDKVYGILNITKGGPRLIPRPTYERSTEDLYTHLTCVLIEISKRLGFIRYKSPRVESQLSMLSWALYLSTLCFDALTQYARFRLSLNSF